jgi:hypothetical protein
MSSNRGDADSDTISKVIEMIPGAEKTHEFKSNQKGSDMQCLVTYGILPMFH